ncbi:uncharacterized protein BDCG_05060 [Blastomyces dermatitidis ER-3]|nr:uncharacterized protein BDCG_05060 [Blastomyces dermatitidis ER-3]EEQ89940.2 hypothetical protein BDCG_05060 [Blastomyces dermatitidis ER-3]EQL37788.1 hypothetical protein BDFG_00837 [Blastomyces dermatitidis ATCC 26199]
MHVRPTQQSRNPSSDKYVIQHNKPTTIMAKTPKLKAKITSKSLRSRAVKRAVSPTDESLLKSLPRAEPIPTFKPHVLSAQHNAGITKKSKSKQLTRAQRRRQEKGMERAEFVMDKTEKKIAKSLGKGRVVKERRATWEEMNRKALAALGKLVSGGGDEDNAEVMDEDGASKGTSTHKAISKPLQQAAPAQKFEFEEDGEIT